MSKTYESLEPQGHFNFAKRVFQKIKGYIDSKVQTDVPANATFTDTKVTQTQDNSTNGSFEVLLAGSTSTTTATEGAKKSSSLVLNPVKASMSVGVDSIASGFFSYAQGNNVVASGESSHAQGDNTIANNFAQSVFGSFNIEDTTPIGESGLLEIVGNGNISERSNARTLDWDGNEVLSGKLTVGTAPTNNMDVTTKLYVDTGLASADEIIEITATDYDALSYAEKHNGKYYHITDRNSSNELDTKVTQTQDDSTNATYEVLLAGSTSATTATESAKKSSGLTYNPSTSVLSMSGTPSGNTDVVTKAYADGKVNKTGDTMTGNLIINSNNAQTIYINPDMMLDTSANNGLSSDSSYGAYFADKNGKLVGDVSMTTRSTGRNYAQLMARNKKTDGTAVTNYIDVIADKDGSSSYYVSNPAAFRNAIDTDYKYWNAFAQTAISLPSSWREILIQIMYNGSFMTATYTNAMIDTERSVSFGNFGISYAVGNLSKTQIKLTIVNWAGSDVTSSAKGYVYYK